MRARTGALISLLLLAACPSGDPAETAATATDSATAPMGTTEVSTSGTTSIPEPEPETFGSACGDPLAGQWGDCINGNAQACGNEEASCLANSTTNPAWGTCILECDDRCDCWAAPEGSGATPECAPVLPGGGLACVLDCSAGQECPDGMNCVALTGVQSLCSFDRDGFDPTGGPEPTTGDDTTTSGDDTTTSASSSGSSSSSTGADTEPTTGTTTGA